MPNSFCMTRSARCGRYPRPHADTTAGSLFSQTYDKFHCMKSVSSAKRPTDRLSDRIRIARRAAGLSQSRLAAQVGVTASAVAQWEQTLGTAPRLAMLKQLAVVAKVSFEWLATGTGRATTRPLKSAKVEVAAAQLGTFAHDSAEETLLLAFRKLRLRDRPLVIQLLESLGRRG